MSRSPRIVWIAAAVLCGACTHLPSVGSTAATVPVPPPTLVSEYLDPQTAMTVRLVAEPYIFGRDVPDLAANARDYVSLGAVELDNMGKHRYFLALVSWSTIDRARSGSALPALPARLAIGNGPSLREWAVTSHEPRQLGAGISVFDPPSGRFGDSWFEVKPADLRALAEHPPASIEVTLEGLRRTFTLWRDGQAALQEFAANLPADMQPARGRRRHIGP